MSPRAQPHASGSTPPAPPPHGAQLTTANDSAVTDSTVAALTDSYQAIPFRPTPERYEIVSYIVRQLCRFETLFTDYERTACSASGAACMECEDCTQRKRSIARTLT